MQTVPLRNPARQQLIEKYEGLAAQGVASKAYTLPLYSTAYVGGDVVDFDPVTGLAFIHFPLGREFSWFNYGQGFQIPSGQVAPQPVQRTATVWDTNLTEANKTPAALDFAIELITCTAARPIIQYPVVPGGLVHPAVVQAFLGANTLVDAASLYAPATVMSPFNLEAPIDSAVRGAISCTLSWGDARTRDPLGMLDELHDSTARSYLQSAGVAEVGAGLYQPEGHLWQGTSLGPDSKLTMFGRIERDIVIQAQVPTWPGGLAPVQALRVILPLKLRLMGLGMTTLGKNA